MGKPLNKDMPIAFVLLCGEKFGGMERRYVRLACHLHSLGLDVVLLCTNEAKRGIYNLGITPPTGLIRTIDWNIENRNLFTRKINRLYGFIRILFLILAHKYTQVHFVANPGYLVYAYSIFQPRRLDYSFSIVDSRLKFNPKILRKCVQQAKAVDCLSETIANHVKAQCINLRNLSQIHTSPCSFTDYSRIKTSPIRDIDITMMARFSPEKGYDILLEALPHFPKNMEIHLCGFGSNKPQTPLAKVYSSDDPFAVLSRTRIFLSLQDQENYPSQSLLEAMASGCAVIASDVGETRKLLDESCAMLIHRDTKSLIEAINYLISHPDEMEALGVAAREKVIKNHTVDKFADYFCREILNIP